MAGRPGDSSIVWSGSLAAHPEQELEDEPAQKLSENNRPPPVLGVFAFYWIHILWMQLRADYVQQRLRLMRKHGIDFRR